MNNQKGFTEILLVSVAALAIIAVLALGFPYYRVWSQEMRGKAALAEATQSKMIQIEQARAELESAELRSKAIEVIGKSTKQVIYVHTEGNIPILEAGKRPVPKD